MNTTKCFLALSLLAMLIGCSEVNDELTVDLNKKFTITGIFGINLGTIDKGLPEGYVIENKAIPFTPDVADTRFSQYEYSTTPKSHIVYGIKLKGPRDLPKESCLTQRDALIKQSINTMGDISQLKVTDDKGKWKVREDNQREVSIECEAAISQDKRQLVMIYQDTALSLQAFKEWKKRQKEITLIRF